LRLEDTFLDVVGRPGRIPIRRRALAEAGKEIVISRIDPANRESSGAGVQIAERRLVEYIIGFHPS
jgi:hypothetical protein